MKIPASLVHFCAFVLLFGLPFLCLQNISHAQGSGTITGRVLDAADDSPLWGTNVTIRTTALGTSTDDEGQYTISNLPAGRYTLLFSYLGYAKLEREVEVRANWTATVDVRLSQSVIPGQEVVVTAQLKGQQAAINQQLTANSIVNVLSQEQIRELPDQNAAEAISRLPGIAVQRDGGEAQKIIIQGLAPKYSNITINGEKIPSTDLTDRSVDLSSISSDMLAGIEVYKSPTADRDGDAIAGSVNFAMKKALDVTVTDIRINGGYNALGRDYGDYKGSITSGSRYFDNAFGAVITASIQRANRGSDGQQEAYSLITEPIPGAPIPYRIDDMRLIDTKEIRKRYGASVALDYNLSVNHSFLFTGFWSQTDRKRDRRRQRYNIQEGRHEFDYVDNESSTQLYSFGMNGFHRMRIPLIGDLEVDWRVATSQSNQKSPFDLYSRFFQMALPGVVTDQGPDMVPGSVSLDTASTWLKEMTYSNEQLVDRNNTFQIDAQSNYSVGSVISGYLKFGAKYTRKSRDRNKQQIIASTVIEKDLGPAIFANPSDFYRSFPLMQDVNHKVLMSGFLTSSDEVGAFLHDKYPSWPSLSGAQLRDFWDHMRYWTASSGTALFDNNQSAQADRFAADNSYRAGEDVLSGYAMTEIHLGDDIMILPGIRYEQTRNNYKSVFGTNGTTPDETPSIVNVHDSTGERTYGVWLPMVQARVNVFEGMNIRASVAKTLSRPDFFNLVPYLMIDRNGSPRTIQKGNPSLTHTSARNYDLSLSVFNRYGLLSVGGFYKRLDNVSYIRTSYIFSGTYSGFRIIQPVNASDPSYVYGGEVELQANLTLLPEPLNGIIISGNFALMKSRTLYPQFQVINQVIQTPPFLVVTVVDTAREAPMPGQADRMGNVTLGYERGGFSGRLSLVFQGRSLAVVGTRAETDGYTDPYYRWDLALQQKILSGISVFANVNNITAAADKSSNQRYITSEQYYGSTIDLGIRFKF